MTKNESLASESDNSEEYRVNLDLMPNGSWKVALWAMREGKCLESLERPNKKSAIRLGKKLVRRAKRQAGDRHWWRTRIISKR